MCLCVFYSHVFCFALLCLVCRVYSASSAVSGMLVMPLDVPLAPSSMAAFFSSIGILISWHISGQK